MPIIKRPLGVTTKYDEISHRQESLDVSGSLEETKTNVGGINTGYFSIPVNKIPGENGQVFTSEDPHPNLSSGINNRKGTTDNDIISPANLTALVGEPKIDEFQLLSSLISTSSKYYQVDTKTTIKPGFEQPNIDKYLPKQITGNYPTAASFVDIPNTTENAERFMGISNKLLLNPKFNSGSPQIIDSKTTNNTGITIDSIQAGNTNNNNVNIIPLGASSNNGNRTGTDKFLQIENTEPDILVGRIGETIPMDFRKKLRGKNKPEIGTAPNAPDYLEKRIELRVNLGDPGYRAGKNLSNYTNGSNKGAIYGRSGGNASNSSYDKINAFPIYESSQVASNGAPVNDLVKFRIGVINNDNPTLKRYIHFRAFLDTITDSYTSEWQDLRYIGRGEKFYNYTGFDRTFSLSWTVAAQSKAELIPMYKKLNYLASVCAPDYSSGGYMRSNIITLTVGGYLYEQPGIIKGITYTMNEENHPWEIGINAEGGSDHTVKELPHIIKVSGFQFIPIHTFVPRLQYNSYAGNNTGNELLDTNVYGKERYIALDNGISDYNNYGPINEIQLPSPPEPPQSDPQPDPNYTPPAQLVELQDPSGNRAIDPTTNQISGNVNLTPVNNGNTGIVNNNAAAQINNNLLGGSIQYINGQKVFVKNK